MTTHRSRKSLPARRGSSISPAPTQPRHPLAASIHAALLPAGLLLSLGSGVVLANPTGGQVVGGTGHITTPNATTTLITQNSQNLAIDWQTFNVKANELVQFNQPNVTATALNQIFDQSASQIYGQIRANGQILLMNPNGLIFGPNARVNVAGLVAAAARVNVDDFMAGNYKLDASMANGAVVNQGLIEAATGGSVTLAGKTVSNEGVIIATAGRVNLVSGSKMTLDFDGDGLLQFTIDEGVLDNPTGAQNAVSNSGTIEANGGMVVMSGRTAANVFTNVVNNSGVIKAARIDNSGGTIRLVADGPGSSVVNSGTLDASGETSTPSPLAGEGGGEGANGGTVQLSAENVTQSGTINADAAHGNGGNVTIQSTDTTLLTSASQTTARSAAGGAGGTVQVLGDKVGLLDTSVVDVSGELGGGTALIGGDQHGGNPNVQNATYTYVAQGANIKADAIKSGDGGKVIVWSNETTQYYGGITAKGGAESGAGGFAEVSGKNNLTFRGVVDLSSITGDYGTLLLDPATITITGGTGDGAADGNNTFKGNPSGTAGTITFADTSPTTVFESEIENLNADIKLQATDSITTSGTFTNSDIVLQNNRNLTLEIQNGTNAGVIDLTTSTNGNALEVKTSGTGSITINGSTSGTKTGDITVGKLTTTGTGGITLNTGNGAITVNGALTTGTLNATGAQTSGSISLTATNAVAINAAVTTGNATTSNNTATTGSISIKGGSITSGASGTLTTGTASGGTGSGNNATSGDITLDTTGGTTISLGAAVTTGGATTTSNGDFGTSGKVVITAGTTVAVNAAIKTGDAVSATEDAISGKIDISGTAISSNGSGTMTTGGASGGNGNGDDDTTGDIILLSSTGDTNLQAALTTGVANSSFSNGTSGNINVTSTAGKIISSGAFTTGDATGDGNTGGAANETATSGTITLKAGGAIQLSATDALRTGNATMTTDNNNSDVATVGNITVTSAASLSSNGTNGAVDVRFGTTSSAGNATLNAGTLSVTTTGGAGDAGGIFVTSGEALILNTLATNAGSSQNVRILLTGNDTLLTVGNNLSLDTDNVIFSADKMNIANTITAGVVTLRPESTADTGDKIDLGSTVDTTANTLELSNTELNRITATTLIIGDNNSGNISVTANTVNPTGITNLHLITGGSVSNSALGNSLEVNNGAGNLAIEAGGTVSLVDNDGEINVTNLAIHATGSITYQDANSFTVNDVDGVFGVHSDTSTVSLTASTGAITVANTSAASGHDVDAAGDITITLNANDTAFTINSGANVNTTTGGITVIADKMVLTGTITDTDATPANIVTLKPVSTDAINLGSTTDLAVNTLELSSTELNNITATTLRIGSATAGAITVSADVSPTNITSLHLINNGDVTAALGGIVVNGGSGNLAVETTGTASFTAVTTNVGTLAASLTGVGKSFTFQNETDGFAVGTVDGITGITTANSAASGTPSGSITLSSGGDITITNNVTTGAASATDTGGVDTVTSGTISVTSKTNVTGAGQLITGTATLSGGSAGGADTVTSGNINVTAGTSGTGGIKLSNLTSALQIGAASRSGATEDTVTAGTISLTSADEINNGTAATRQVVTTGTASGGATNVQGLLAAATTGANAGIYLTSPSALSLGAVTTVSGNIDILSGATLTATTAVTAGGTGTVLLTGVGVTNQSTITGPGGVTIDAGTGTLDNTALNATITNGGGATATAVTLIADVMKLGSTGNLNQVQGGAGTVTLRQKTNGTAIDLGSAVDTTANTLELSDTELKTIATTGVLAIGDGNTGAITVSADVTPGPATLHLTTGSTVTGTAGGIVVNNLAITAGNTINFTDATTAVSKLAISNAGKSVTFTEADGFTVDTVDGVNGISGSTVTLTATTGGITVADTAAAHDIDATGAVALNANGNDQTFTINASADVRTISGGVTVTSDKMVLNGTITATGQVVTLKPVSTDAIDLGSATDAAANTLELSNTEINNVTATTLRVGSATAGAITISSNIDELTTPTITNLHLLTNSTITDTAALKVSGLAITSAGAVNLTNAGTDVNTIAASVTGGGNSFTFKNDANGFTVGSVDGVTGISTANVTNAGASATTGSITLQSGGGITFSNNVTTGNATASTAGFDATSGSISINVGANNLSGLGSLVIGSATASGGASTATTGDLSLTAAEIAGDPGAGTSVVPLAVTMAAGTGGGTANVQGKFNATATGSGTAGEINVSSSGPLTIGTLDTTDADTTNVKVTVTGGNLLTVSGASSLDQDNLVLTADKMDIQNTISFDSNKGKATLQNSTAGVLINLGTVTDANLELSAAEIGRVRASTLIIGSATAGAIGVSNANITTDANTNILHLITNSTVTANGGFGINVPNLAVEANGAVNIVNGANTVNFVAFNDPGKTVSFSQNATFGVAPVDTVNTTKTGALTLTSNAGDITVFNPGVYATGKVSINVNTANKTFTITGGSDVKTISGGVYVKADNMSIYGTITATGQAVNLQTFTASRNVQLGSNAAAGRLDLSNTELNNIKATTLRISGYRIRIRYGDISPAQITNLHLTGTRFVYDGLVGNHGVQVTNLAVTAGQGVYLNSTTNNVSTLAGSTTGLSPGRFQFLNNVGGFTVGTVDSGGFQEVGIHTANNSPGAGFASTGFVSISTQSGDITLANDVKTGNATATAGNSAQSGAITVTAGGTGLIKSTGGKLIIGNATSGGGGGTTATTGNLSLTAAEIAYDAGAGVSTQPLDISIPLASGGATNTQGQLNATATGTGTGGEINVISTTGPLNVGTLDTTDADKTNVTVTVTGGNSLTISGASNLDIDDVVFAADRMLVNNTITAGTATLENATAGRAINLGSTTDVAAALELSDAEIDRFTVNTLRVGRNDASASGAITVSNDITPAGTSTLHLITGSTVTATTGSGGTLIVSNLAVDAGGTITITKSNTDVSTLAINDAGQSVTYTDANSFSVGSVDGVNGITSGALTLTATTGNIKVTDTAAASDINASGAVAINANGANQTFTINSSADVKTTSGGVTATADNMSIYGTITAATQIVTLQPFSANRLIRLGSNVAGRLSFTDAELDNITATTLRIGSASASHISINGGDISPANVTDLHLISGRYVYGFSNGIQVTNLAITAGTGVLLYSPGNTNQVTTLAINAPNHVHFRATGGFTVGAVDGVTGISAGSYNAQLEANSGITVNENIATTVQTIINADFDNNGTGTLTVATGKSVNTGNNTLNVTAADLALNGTGALNSGGAATTITVSNNGTLGLGAAAGQMTVSNAELTNITANGTTFVTTGATGDMTVDGVTTGATTNTGLVTLTGGHNITFSGGASTFANGLSATGANNVAVNAGVSTAKNTNLSLTATAGAISFGSGVTVAAGDGTGTTGTLTLSSNGAMTGSGGLTLDSENGLTLNQSLTTSGATTIDADTNADGTGTFTVAGGVTLATTGAAATGAALNITAADLALNGNLNSGTASATTITESANTGIGLGATANGNMQIDDGEVGRIAASGLVLVTDGSFVVDGVTSVTNINRSITFAPASITTTSVNFKNNFSDFDAFGTAGSDDTFTFTGTAVLKGNVDGDLGNDTLDFSGLTSQTIFTTLNASGGTKDGVKGNFHDTVGPPIFTTTFDNINNLNGNGTGLQGPDLDNIWTIDGKNSGNLKSYTIGSNFTVQVGGTFTFNSFALGGGNARDNFILAGGALFNSNAAIVNIDGCSSSGCGTAQDINTITGDNFTNIWTITGANKGTLTNSDGTDLGGGVLQGTLSGGFRNIDTLTGGTGDDTFVFQNNGSLNRPGGGGGIDGGTAVTHNTIDISAIAGIAHTVNLTNGTISGVNGNSVTVLGGTFTNVTDFVGNGTDDTLEKDSGTNTFTISGANSGDVNGGAFTFAGFPNLTGGSGNDTFAFTGTGSVGGDIEGEGGTNTLDFSGYGSKVQVTLTGPGSTSTATSRAPPAPSAVHSMTSPC